MDQTPDIPALPEATSPQPEKPSFTKKAITYAKKNWWLILVPTVLLPVVLIIKHRKKQ